MGDAELAKNRLLRDIENDSRVQSVIKATEHRSRSAWKVETHQSTKIIWVTYSKFAGDSTRSESPFYGSTWNSMTDLRKDHPLYLIFLGVTDDHRWTVPFADFVSRFEVNDKKEGNDWRFNFDAGDNRTLLSEYRGIDPLFEF